MTKRQVAKAAGLVFATLIALELVYIVAVKVALKNLPRWASYDALLLSYSDAGSWIPGRVWIRDVVVRGHDSNIQFELRVKEAQLDVALLQLLSRHFHATKAVVSGVEFRVRHNVETLEGQQRRIDAFPPIPGYEAPPVYPDQHETPGPPEDAWVIEMDDVTAQVNDVWVVEYRYSGPGTAKGGFSLDPGRAFHLKPSQFIWQGGTLRVGETPVARRAVGVVDGEMHLDDVQRIVGFGFTDKVKVDLMLSLSGGELAFLNVYSGQMPLKRVSGDYAAEVRLRTDKGKVLEGTEVDLKFENLLLNTARLDVASTGVFNFVARHDSPTDEAGAKEANGSRLSVSVQDTVIVVGGSRSKPFTASIKSNSVRWLTNTPSPALQATVDVHMKPGDALLETALGAVPAALADAFLDLPALHSRVAVYLTEGKSRIELLQLDAGDVQASGTWQDKPAGGRGGFSVKTSVVDVNLAVDRRGVTWDLE